MARSSSKKKGRKGKGKKKGAIKVDFEGVESGGGRPVPDGPYRAEVAVASLEESDEGNDYIKLRLKMVEGLGKGTKRGVGGSVFDNLSLQPQALWKMRGFLESAGWEVEDGVMDIDVDDLVGIEVGIEVLNEEWEGKDRPKSAGYFPLEEAEEEEEEESEEEEEPEEEEEEEPEEEEEEEEEEEAPKKRSRKGKKESPKGGKGKKIRAGSKVKFKDEEGDWVKGVVTDIEDDTATIEDSSGDNWEVEVSELKAA